MINGIDDASINFKNSQLNSFHNSIILDKESEPDEALQYIKNLYIYMAISIYCKFDIKY